MTFAPIELNNKSPNFECKRLLITIILSFVRNEEFSLNNLLEAKYDLSSICADMKLTIFALNNNILDII